MLKTRNEILIKKVFQSDFTWEQLEKYFNINWRLLKQNLEEDVKNNLSSNVNLKGIFDKIENNKKKRIQKIE